MLTCTILIKILSINYAILSFHGLFHGYMLMSGEILCDTYIYELRYVHDEDQLLNYFFF